MILSRTDVEAHLFTDERGRSFARYCGLTLHSVFQPIFSPDKQVVGHEALLRVKSSEGTPLNADLLFHSHTFSAEEQIDIEKLSRVIHIRNFACSSMRDRRLFLNMLPRSSEHLIHDKSSVTLLTRRLRELGISPEQVVLELVEARSEDDLRLRNSVRTLKELGFNIAVDDYGMAASDSYRVNLLQPDIIKLDKSLLTAYMAGDKAALCDALELSARLNATTVVEGIETEQQFNCMKKLNVALFQGFHLAFPQPLSSGRDQFLPYSPASLFSVI